MTTPATSVTPESDSPAPAPAPDPPPLDWRKLHAFGLPGGSVRAILALAIFGGIWAWLWLRPEHEVPGYLQNLMFIIMGHYFAARAAKEAGPDPGPPPLYLPRGTVRVVLVGGFVAVAAGLFYQHRLATRGGGGLRLNHGGVTLILVAGFLLGVAGSHLRRWWAGRVHRRPPRAVEDVRAAVSLAAAAALLVLAFGFWSVPGGGALEDFQRFFVKYRIEDVLAAVVGFYFGSRS